MKILLFLFPILLITSCSERPSKSEYDKLKTELEECKKENDENQKLILELKITPEQRLSEAKKLFDEDNLAEAKIKYESIINRYPESEISKKANVFLNQIKLIIEKQIAEEERLKTLGFKALKESNKVKVDDVTISFNSISYSKTFTFDRYDDYYHYREAERGNKFIVASVSISSESKDPKLPPVFVYKISNGVLNYLTTLDYEFNRWDDYGSYLGNTADFRNDFSHTKTIRFELGAQLSEEELKNYPIFIVVGNESIFYRSYDRFSNPPVSYHKTTYDYKNILKVEDFKQDYYLVKIFNKNLL